MRRFAGSCRFVLNEALALQKARCELGEKNLWYAGLCRLLTEWHNSPGTAWLAEAPVHPLQQALKDLEWAHGDLFAKRAALPRFRKKGGRDNFRCPKSKQVKLAQDNSRAFLPKLGWVRYRNSQEALVQVRSVTVSLSGGDGSRASRPSAKFKTRHLRRLPPSASTRAWPPSPPFRTAPSSPRSTASSGMKPPCARRSRP